MGWLRQLPPRVVPRELARQFPRIVNRLARFWDSPTACREYIDSLLISGRRGRRRGFPPEVQAQIFMLSEYYRKLHAPATRDVWDDVRDSTRSTPKHREPR